MDALDVLQQRVSVPRLGGDVPSKDVLQNIFKAALRVPDHAQLRPWRFLLISGDSRENPSNKKNTPPCRGRAGGRFFLTLPNISGTSAQSIVSGSLVWLFELHCDHCYSMQRSASFCTHAFGPGGSFAGSGSVCLGGTERRAKPGAESRRAQTDPDPANTANRAKCMGENMTQISSTRFF